LQYGESYNFRLMIFQDIKERVVVNKTAYSEMQCCPNLTMQTELKQSLTIF
jgi:hypothetical protein